MNKKEREREGGHISSFPFMCLKYLVIKRYNFFISTFFLVSNYTSTLTLSPFNSCLCHCLFLCYKNTQSIYISVTYNAPFLCLYSVYHSIPHSALLRASIKNSCIYHIKCQPLSNLGILFPKIVTESDVLSIYK